MRFSKKWLLVIAVAVVLLVLFLIFRKSPSKNKEVETAKISNFQDCFRAGYQVKAGLPRECSTPDGRVFVETGAPQNNSNSGTKIR